MRATNLKLGLRVSCCALCSAGAWGPAGCASEHGAQRAGSTNPPSQAPLAPRPVRVLLGESLDAIRLRADRDLQLTDARGSGLGALSAAEWTECRAGSGTGLRLGGVHVAADEVFIRGWAEAGAILSRRSAEGWEPAMTLPGAMQIRRDERGLTLINAVDVETYISCVTAREIPSNFHPEAFRTQAVLCRTFALYQMRRRDAQDFDLLASEGSQVYTGFVGGEAGEKASAAAADTMGLVCTCLRDGQEDIFPTYYSSACGGSTQSAWPFNPSDRIEALAGNVRCDFCRIAPANVYRWGPVEIPEASVRQAVQERYPRLSTLGPLTRVEGVSQTPDGRLLEVRMTDARGGEWKLPADRLRLAIGSRVMRSTDCHVSLAGSQVRLETGRGFGHGLGLCQWGMQGQALAGRTAAQILRFYYPGSQLTRVY